MISGRPASAARPWKGSALHKQLDQAGRQDAQPGSLLMQRSPSAMRGAPRAASLGSRYASGGRSSDDEEDEEGRQQRQWRQRTLRSLRQDLSHQQRRQQGQPSSTRWHTGQGGRSSQPRPSDPKVASDPAWQQAGGARRGAARAAPASLPPSQRGVPSTSSKGDSGMHPDGYFLDILRAQGVVGPDGRPTQQGLSQGVGFSTYLNVGINKMLAQSTDLATILSIVRDIGYLMDSINTSTAVHRLGKLARRRREVEAGVNRRLVSHPSYLALVTRVEQLVPEYQPRGLANTMWGLAALGDVDRADLARKLALAIVRHPPGEYQSQELSNVVWAMGTLGVLCEEALDQLLEGVVQQIDFFIPQGLSNMIWATAHLRNGTRGCVGPHSGGNPPTGVPRDLRPGWQPSPAFLAAVAATATQRMNEFQSQTLSNLLWGFCKLDVYPQQLFEAAAAELVERFRTPELARQFRAQELSNSIYAFAQGNIINEQLLSAFERELSTSWVELDSMGRERRVTRLDDFTSQALANTLWSFAYLRWYPALLLEPITRAVGRKMHSMSSQEISNSIWSFAKFAYHPGPVMAQYQVEIARRVEQFDGQSLTTTMWAMAALSATHCDAFVKLVERFVVLERTGTFQDVQYNQVLQAVLLAQFEMQRQPGEFRADIDLPDGVVDRALQAWQVQQQAAKLSSFQLEVSAALGQLGIEHEMEYLTAVNLLSVDIAIVKGGKKIAVEVDGPFHFSVNTNSPLGQTMIRRRLLRAVGWTVISVPYHTWYKLPQDQRAVYLSRLLVRKDGSFHQQIMQVSEDLLSTEFKRGLGREAGVDALSDEEGDAVARRRMVPRNLGQLLEREGLMLTKGAAKRLVDMGFAEHVSVGDGQGQEAVSVYQARRAAPSSEEPPIGAARTADGSDGGEAGAMTIDAIIEAARTGDSGESSADELTAAVDGSMVLAAGPAPHKDAPRSGSAPSPATSRALQVDEVDLENPLRPRYTDYSGNVLLEGIEPFNPHNVQQQRNLTDRAAKPNARSRSTSPQALGASLRTPVRRNPMARRQKQPKGKLLPHTTKPETGALPDEQPPMRASPTSTSPSQRLRRVPLEQQLPIRQGPLPWQSPMASAGVAPKEPAQQSDGGLRNAIQLRQQHPPTTRKTVEARRLETGMPSGSNFMHLASKLSLDDLKRLASSQGLPASGTKAQVAARLAAHSKQKRTQRKE